MTPTEITQDTWALQTLGQPYEGTPGPREEGPRYNFKYGSHSLTAFVKEPTEEEIYVYGNNPVRIGFWKNAPVLWAIFHIEGLGWQDAPYTPHKVEPEGRTFPELTGPDSRYLVTIMLADANDGAVRALRVATMSPETSQQIRTQTRELMEREFSEQEFDRSMRETYRKYPTTAHMRKLPPRIDLMGSP